MLPISFILLLLYINYYFKRINNRSFKFNSLKYSQDQLGIIRMHLNSLGDYSVNIDIEVLFYNHNQSCLLFLPRLRSPPLSYLSSLSLRGGRLSPDLSLPPLLSPLPSPLVSLRSARSFSPFSQDSLVKKSLLIARGT